RRVAVLAGARGAVLAEQTGLARHAAGTTAVHARDAGGAEGRTRRRHEEDPAAATRAGRRTVDAARRGETARGAEDCRIRAGADGDRAGGADLEGTAARTRRRAPGASAAS